MPLRRARSFPDSWRRLLEARMLHWRLLDAPEKTRLEQLTLGFIDRTAFEGAVGFELTEEMQVLISAQAALMVLELGLDYHRGVTTIIVHPASALRTGERHLGGGVMTDEPVLLDGEARLHGPVMISWDAALRSARHPGSTQNVVLHELAHKIDMLGGGIDGTPPLPNRSTRERWVAVCETELQLVQAGLAQGVLDAYAGTNPAEFFAVATEAFFDRSIALEAQHPGLYEVFRSFYRQDPATRWRRG